MDKQKSNRSASAPRPRASAGSGVNHTMLPWLLASIICTLLFFILLPFRASAVVVGHFTDWYWWHATVLFHLPSWRDLWIVYSSKPNSVLSGNEERKETP